MRNIQKKIDKTFSLIEKKDQSIEKFGMGNPISLLKQASMIIIISIIVISFLGQDYLIQYHPFRLAHNMFKVIPIVITLVLIFGISISYSNYKKYFRKNKLSFWKFLKIREKNIKKFRKEFGSIKRTLYTYNELKELNENILDEDFYNFTKNYLENKKKLSEIDQRKSERISFLTNKTNEEYKKEKENIIINKGRV